MDANLGSDEELGRGNSTLKRNKKNMQERKMKKICTCCTKEQKPIVKGVYVDPSISLISLDQFFSSQRRRLPHRFRSNGPVCAQSRESISRPGDEQSAVGVHHQQVPGWVGVRLHEPEDPVHHRTLVLRGVRRRVHL